MNPASTVYAAVARRRRAWYARHPEARRRLARPVVSVGNVAVGGSGKTPLVSHLARLLLEMGERPSILTRGYGREVAPPGVTVVSDGVRLQADLGRAGDEPLMLARSLDGVPVLVGSDRYLSGCLAERRFGCTVHLLDDGFQHFPLLRSADLVVVRRDDLARPETLPGGRLREPLDVLAAADAIVAGDGMGDQELRMLPSRAVPVFRMCPRVEPARFLEPAGRVAQPAPGTRVLAVAGIARPERFFATIEDQGWTLGGQVAFRDHHRFDAADIRRIAHAMAAARAVMVVTTEKDLVRLLPLRPLPMPVAWVPLTVTVEPAAGFREWLGGRIERNS